MENRRPESVPTLYLEAVTVNENHNTVGTDVTSVIKAPSRENPSLTRQSICLLLQCVPSLEWHTMQQNQSTIWSRAEIYRIGRYPIVQIFTKLDTFREKIGSSGRI